MCKYQHSASSVHYFIKKKVGNGFCLPMHLPCPLLYSQIQKSVIVSMMSFTCIYIYSCSLGKRCCWFYQQQNYLPSC